MTTNKIERKFFTLEKRQLFKFYKEVLKLNMKVFVKYVERSKENATFVTENVFFIIVLKFGIKIRARDIKVFTSLFFFRNRQAYMFI